MHSRGLGVVGAVLCLLTSCSGATVAIPEANVETAPPSATAPSPDAPARSGSTSTKAEITRRESSEPISCNDGDRVAVVFSTVDASLGARDMAMVVRNCSDEAITLPAEPPFDGLGDDGDIYEASWEWEEAQGSLQLVPGADKLILAHWSSNGRCERGARELRLHLFDQVFSARDCFQFGGDMAPEREGGDGRLNWADVPVDGLDWLQEG